MKLPSTDRGAIDKLKNHFSKVQIADMDGDLDRDPYTSAAWSGNAFSTGVGTINWVTDFGLPEIPKLVCLYVIARDLGAAPWVNYIAFKAKVTTTQTSFGALVPGNDLENSVQGWVAVADAGTTYYLIVASGAGTMDIWIRVIAWET